MSIKNCKSCYGFKIPWVIYLEFKCLWSRLAASLVDPTGRPLKVWNTLQLTIREPTEKTRKLQHYSNYFHSALCIAILKVTVTPTSHHVHFCVTFVVLTFYVQSARKANWNIPDPWDLGAEQYISSRLDARGTIELMTLGSVSALSWLWNWMSLTQVM